MARSNTTKTTIITTTKQTLPVPAAPASNAGEISDADVFGSLLTPKKGRTMTVVPVAEAPPQAEPQTVETATTIPISESPNGDSVPVEGVETPAGSNGEAAAPTTEVEWRKFLSELNTARVATYEKNIKEFTEQVEAIGEVLKGLGVMIAKTPAGKKKDNWQKEYDNEESKRNRVQEKLDAEQAKYDKIKGAATGKAETRKAIDDKKLAQQEGALAKTAGAKVDKFIHRQLTPEENAKLNDIETKAQEFWEQWQQGKMGFARMLQEVWDQKLYVNYEAGYEGYCKARWEISRATAYRKLASAEQFDKILALTAMDVQYVDAEGKPVKVKLDASKLPQTEWLLRALKRYGSPENQLQVWAKVTGEAQAKNVQPSEVAIKRIGDAMVKTGVIAVGLDAKLESAQKERKARGEVKVSPLVFNIYIGRAKYRGHDIDTYSYKREDGVEVFEVHIDQVPVEKGGEVLRVFTLDQAIRFAETCAAEMFPDEWKEDTAAANATPVPAESPVGDTPANDAGPVAPANGAAKTRKRAAKAEVPLPTPSVDAETATESFWVGWDGNIGKVLTMAKDEEPDLDQLGYDKISGPFESSEYATNFIEALPDGPPDDDDF